MQYLSDPNAAACSVCACGSLSLLTIFGWCLWPIVLGFVGAALWTLVATLVHRAKNRRNQ